MKEPLMRTRFNRRSFLKSSAASWLAASKLRNSVAWASTGADKRFKEWRSLGGGTRGGGDFPPVPKNPFNHTGFCGPLAFPTTDKIDPPPAAILDTHHICPALVDI